MTHLPRTQWRHDAIWVILDRLTKSAHFLVVRMTFTLEEFCRVYICEIVRLHEVPISIVSDRDPKLQHTLEEFPEGHGDAVDDEHRFFYPHTDGQLERTIQVLEDMLRASVLNLKGNWEKHLPLVEFAYNNNF